jgi:uncharacterized protein (TIGR02588 family)
MTENESREPPRESSGPDWVERLATIISGVLVLGVIAVLLWDAVHPDRPPALDVSTGTPTAVGRHWHVPIIVRNSGDVAVQEVNVSVGLEHPDTTVRDVDIRIDWLPGRSQRAIDAVFAVDPARGKLTAEVQSFDEP